VCFNLRHPPGEQKLLEVVGGTFFLNSAVVRSFVMPCAHAILHKLIHFEGSIGCHDAVNRIDIALIDHINDGFFYGLSAPAPHRSAQTRQNIPPRAKGLKIHRF
jgi:hypothetical protein